MQGLNNEYGAGVTVASQHGPRVLTLKTVGNERTAGSSKPVGPINLTEACMDRSSINRSALSTQLLQSHLCGGLLVAGTEIESLSCVQAQADSCSAETASVWSVVCCKQKNVLLCTLTSTRSPNGCKSAQSSAVAAEYANPHFHTS